MPKEKLSLTTESVFQPKNRKKRKSVEDVSQDQTEDEVLDEDGVFKDFITRNVPNVIALLNFELYCAIDWSVDFVFCEQELINTLRGRARLLGKRKVADKLIKFKLLTGEDHYVFLHNEVQNSLTDELAERWFSSRSLIALRYGVDRITAIVIFTGKPPLKKHIIYDHTCFGTRTLYKVNAFVIVKLSAKKLMEADNPVALAFLAAKYAVDSKGNDKKRFRLKKKVLDLVEKRGYPLEIMLSLLNFVFDYMLLPQKLEDELKSNISYFQSLKSENKMVVMSQNQLDIRNAMCLNETGMSFIELVHFKNAEVAAATAAAAKEINLKSIHGMLKADFSIEKIADILELEVSYVQELAALKVSK
jgi:hypothetical protein